MNSLFDSKKFEAVKKALIKNESIAIEGLWNAPKALIATLSLHTTHKNILIITGASQEETRLYHDFAFFTSEALDFPAWETLPSEEIAPSPDIVGDRYKLLQNVLHEEKPQIILTTLQAVFQKVINKNKFSKLYLTLKVKDSYSFDGFIEKLQEMGYIKKPVASDKGEFAIRGGIIDVFSVSSPDPFRIEFWGDDIESIRTYDPIGQKSIKSLLEVQITPAQELELLKNETHLSTLIDYLGTNTLIIFDDILALEDRYASLVNICGSFPNSFCSLEEWLKITKDLQKIFLSKEPLETLSHVQLLEKQSTSYYSEEAPLYKIGFEIFNQSFTSYKWQHPFVELADYLIDDSLQEVTGLDILSAVARLKFKNNTLELICESELEIASLQKKVLDADINLPSDSHYKLGYLSSGFVLDKSIYLPYTIISGRYKIRRQKQRNAYHHFSEVTYQLEPGDIVVHLNNGIGKFLQMEKKVNHEGILQEFFVIEYADNAKLFVPISQAYLISKYIGSDEEIPKFHTIGSSKWKKTKEQTEKAILNYAKDLLELYAKRSIKEGFSFSNDSDLMRAFEEDFPFTETEDQKNAIADIKVDMQAPHCMDRLICGDVGYGKTEVAMRAAFKAVVDGKKQVAVLVPTTVLAMQHYENFLERMSNFPINIALISRFQTSKQVKEILEKLALGQVDILIGTHRIVGKDIQFNDLGLVIIDEEQRFGVKVKEYLKKVKVSIDCITLSATPIPRTLYMSLMGARDLSIINTPPQDRLPISTIVADLSDELIKTALLRELARNGQAYIIHNRVETIHAFAERVQKLLPKARIVVGHGQMHSDEMDLVFHAFKKGDADILIATTIIESGIDIPNANTIIVDRADRFGMADLYQLRGRVGRWYKKAYAYFTVPKSRSLPENSRKRLNALVEASGYGGGMKIAMRDLELRGAGNILGHEQSGHVEAVGFHLYRKMLERTLKRMQGKIPYSLTETKVEFAIDARLPDDYINEASLRMEIYQRLGDAISIADVETIWAEIKDRFGKPPLPALWLYHLTKIRVLASLQGYSLVKMDKVTLHLEKPKGKDSIIRRVLLGSFKTPEEMEKKVLKALELH